MKISKTKRLSLLSIFAVFVILWVGYAICERTWDKSLMYVIFWVMFIVLWIVIVNKKEKFFLEDIKWKFYNNEKAWKKAYKVWAILAFFIWILLIANTTIHIFPDLTMGNILAAATVLTLLITLVYLFKYKE